MILEMAVLKVKPGLADPFPRGVQDRRVHHRRLPRLRLAPSSTAAWRIRTSSCSSCAGGRSTTTRAASAAPPSTNGGRRSCIISTTRSRPSCTTSCDPRHSLRAERRVVHRLHDGGHGPLNLIVTPGPLLPPRGGAGVAAVRALHGSARLVLATDPARPTGHRALRRHGSRDDLDDAMDDIRAVMDDAGVERAVLLGGPRAAHVHAVRRHVPAARIRRWC